MAKLPPRICFEAARSMATRGDDSPLLQTSHTPRLPGRGRGTHRRRAVRSDRRHVRPSSRRGSRGRGRIAGCVRGPVASGDHSMSQVLGTHPPHPAHQLLSLLRCELRRWSLLTAKETVRAGLHANCAASRFGMQWDCLECGFNGPGRIRTYDQGIHLPRSFPREWTISSPAHFVRVGAGCSSLSSRALEPSGSLCTFRRCTGGSAQGCHGS